MRSGAAGGECGADDAVGGSVARCGLDASSCGVACTAVSRLAVNSSLVANRHACVFLKTARLGFYDAVRHRCLGSVPGRELFLAR